MASAAKQRYNRHVMGLSMAYALCLVGAEYAFRHGLADGPLGMVAAVLPALSIVGIFAAIGRYLVAEQDEYLRMLMVRQTLWASGFALSIATVWGFLEAFGQVGHVASYAVAILWFGGLGLGGIANRLSMARAA